MREPIIEPNGAPAYVDHAASTPMRPEVFEAMVPFLRANMANPTGSHTPAREARRAIDEARDVVAEALGVLPGEVVFVGTGTEADNLAVLGVVRRRGGVAVCSAVEHHAVLHSVEHVGGRTVAVDRYGRIDLDRLASALDDSVSLVSVMAVNNEVGTITPMAELAEVVRRLAPGAVLHTDAIQAHSWVDTAATAHLVDAMSLSGHKVGGPKGIGALILRGALVVEPLVFGGGQERDRRSGTHDVAGIVGFAEALRLSTMERADTVARVGALRDRLVDGLRATVPGLSETVPRDFKVAANAHVCVDGVESEALLFLLDRAGVYASAGSSCSSGAVSGSHVLEGMGLAPSVAAGALRLTLGWSSTQAEVDHVLAVVPEVVSQLRRPVTAGRR